MIDWIFDRLWAFKNRGELRQLDEQCDQLRAEGERLDRRMEEAFGPDWQRLSENRLAQVMGARFRVE